MKYKQNTTMRGILIGGGLMNLFEHIIRVGESRLGIILKKQDQYGQMQYYVFGPVGNLGRFTFDKTFDVKLIPMKSNKPIEISVPNKEKRHAKGKHLALLRLPEPIENAIDFDGFVLTKKEMLESHIYEGHNAFLLEYIDAKNLGGLSPVANYRPVLRKGSVSGITDCYDGQEEQFLCDITSKNNDYGNLLLFKLNNEFKLIGILDRLVEQRRMTRYPGYFNMGVFHFADELNDLVKELESHIEYQVEEDREFFQKEREVDY